MPSSRADQSDRGTLTREAARRRSVHVLKVAEAIARYGSEQINNGLGPEQARRAALDAANGLEQIAGELRRLTRTARIDLAGRRALTVELSADGLSQRAIAARLGVSKKTVYDDLRRSRPRLARRGRLAEILGPERGEAP
jgi:DNA-binding CsgD family transcriptional regulator